MISRRTLLAASPLLPLILLAGPAHAEDFYKGKTITIITSTGSGGSYAAAARAVARHMPNHIPGKPNIVVKNMPGGGHTRATNFLFNTAPKDGTVIGTVVHTVPMHQVIDGRGVRYDSRKFEWLGGAGISNLTMVVWHTTGIESLEEAMKKQVTMGATGTGSGTYIYPNALNKLLGTRFKIVIGYRKSVSIDLAMQRGEVGGRGGGSFGALATKRADWLKDNKIKVIAQIGYERDPAIKDVPLLQEFAKDKETKQILRYISSPVKLGRPYMAPPGTPADRVAILRKAFDATMKDKAFLEEAKRLGLDLAPMPAAEVQKIVDETVGASPDLIAKVKAAIAPSAEDRKAAQEARKKRKKKKESAGK